MTTRPARPALDAWLAKADRVLSEARDDALSPSIATGPWDEHRTERATTLAELEAALEGLLSRLVFGPGRWALIAEDGDGRYVQALAFEDGSLIAEVVSNNYLQGERRWGEADEDKLLALGWDRPVGKRLNWRVSYPTISPDVAEASVLLLVTLRTVFRLGEAGPLRLSMFSCRQREGTPASQAAGADDDDEAATGQATLGQATEDCSGAAGLDELRAQLVAAIERLRETEDWGNEIWVAEVRRVVDSWDRARLGEGWWAAREGEMDRAWAAVKRYAVERGGDPRRIHGQCWALPNFLGHSLYDFGFRVLRADHHGKLGD
jgi:hypothetical protein